MNFRERIAQIAAMSDPSVCWNWPGFCDKGYGKVMTTLDTRGSRVWFAHVAAYTVLVGPVPEGLELDHLCRNPPCINPCHLEPVTRRVNVLRGVSPLAENARKTHCVRGHALAAENVYTRTNRYGNEERACKTCAIEDAMASARSNRARDPQEFKRRARDHTRAYRARKAEREKQQAS